MFFDFLARIVWRVPVWNVFSVRNVSQFGTFSQFLVHSTSSGINRRAIFIIFLLSIFATETLVENFHQFGHIILRKIIVIVAGTVETVNLPNMTLDSWGCCSFVVAKFAMIHLLVQMSLNMVDEWRNATRRPISWTNSAGNAILNLWSLL